MSSIFSTDIYQIADTVDTLQKQYIPDINDSTRSIGILGYLNDIESTQIQNAIITAAEMANEMWPSRAKFEKNVIAHAIIYNIVDINAIPARMEICFGIEEMELENILVNDQFILDKESPINIGEYEFHLPYDVVISRNVVLNNEKVYTARYKIDRSNDLYKDLTNPYLSAPFIQIYQTKRYIMIRCMIMQVEHKTETKRLLTSSPIENKTLEFDFENQLATFVVKVTERGKTTYLTPVFEGIGVDQKIEDFCYYSYEDINSIRVRFDSISYMPTINAQIEVEVKTTHGKEPDFTNYNESLFVSMSSNRYGYNNVNLFVMPCGATNGRDRKSIEELQRLLPKEALSRGSIANISDLISYFKMLDNDYARMVFQKKVDNQFERTYYSFLLLKDSYNNVVPTNTLDILVKKDGDFDNHDNRKRSLKTGCAIAYTKNQNYGTIISRDEADAFIESDPNNHFVYTVPFTLVLTDDPLYVSYYLTLMNYSALLNFSFINEVCPIQFICTSVIWRRGYSEDPNIYKLNFSLLQNINADYNIVTVDDTGNIIENATKVVVVFYNNGIYDDNSKPYRYAFAELDDYNSGVYSFDYHLYIRTDDKINDDAKIKVFDMYIPGSTIKDYGYLSGDVNVKIYVLAKVPDGSNYGRYDLDSIIPEGLEEYTVTNMYDVENGLNMYINFSDIVRSTAIAKNISTDYDVEKGFLIKKVPLIKRSYANDEANIQSFARMLLNRKAYIDRGVFLLENNFNVDFKLFNTYGPSRIYSLDENGEQIIHRINMSYNFEIKLTRASDKYTKDYIIKDIKEMIENLNDMTDLHIPNLITKITNKYFPHSIEYIEFLGFDDYGPGEQHLYRNEYDDVTIIPEFISCNVDDNREVEINIHVV